MPGPLDGQQDVILTLDSPDRPGIVYAVSGFLAGQGANITEAQQYRDDRTEHFFMRVRFTRGLAGLATLQAAFAAVAEPFAMSWRMVDARTPTRALVLVSRFGHCLNDLLYRSEVGSLNLDIAAIGSNHEDFAELADRHRVPFHHIPVTAGTKDRSEAQILRLVQEYDVDLVILARYMQVLSDDLCGRLDGRAINIHHSFLPSFRGAKPYQQAHARGVKLIGATAHYVTRDLDEGPIIEQDVVRVDHSYSPAQLVVAGRDVETQVLARAVAWHTEHRVFRNGGSTVVLR